MAMMRTWLDPEHEYTPALYEHEAEALAALLSEVERLRAERERRDSEWHGCSVCLGSPLKSGRACICGGVGTEQAEMHGLRVGLFDAQDALAQAREALREFGNHKSGCDSWRNSPHDCACGFRAALSASAPEPKP